MGAQVSVFCATECLYLTMVCLSTSHVSSVNPSSPEGNSKEMSYIEKKKKTKTVFLFAFPAYLFELSSKVRRGGGGGDLTFCFYYSLQVVNDAESVDK